MATDQHYALTRALAGDSPARRMGVLAQLRGAHAALAHRPVPAPGAGASPQRVSTDARETTAPDDPQRAFVLGVVQPGLAGLMDGSISSLAPLFAAAFATRDSHTAFLVGVATAFGAVISMAFSEGLSDAGRVGGRGSPWVRGPVCRLMTGLGAVGHTLPFLLPAFLTAVLLAGAAVLPEPLVVASLLNHFNDTPPFL